MSSSVVRLDTGVADNVVDLGVARHARAHRLRRRAGRTVVVQVAGAGAHGEVYRHLGVNDHMHLFDLHRVLDVCLGFDGDVAGADRPAWWFSRDGEELDGAQPVWRHLGHPGAEVLYHWGLWVLPVGVVAAFARDRNTPDALCVGGSGSFTGSDFDLPGVNARLTGAEAIRDVLVAVRPQVRGLISRSGLFDFVPLLQALDLAGPVAGGSSPAGLVPLDRLPVETDPRAVDAFWATVLALACLSDAALTDEVVTTTMAALGWPGADGGRMSAAEARRLCARSLAQLQARGACGPDPVAPVDRLEIYRALLTGGRAGVD